MKVFQNFPAALRLGCLALVGVTACLPVSTASQPHPDGLPHILFLLVDDQRNDTLGCAGHHLLQTPVIDSLAASGVRFENAFVTTSICAASRASLLTGVHERNHGFTFGTPPLGEAYLAGAYPVLLRKAGYRTGFIGKFGMQVEGGEGAGLFDVFHPVDRNPYFVPQADGSTRHEAEVCGDRAIEFISSHDGSRPFCLSVSFNSVHAEDSDLENHFPWPRAVDHLYVDTPMPRPRLDDPAVFESMPPFLKHSLNRQRYHWRWDTPEKYDRNMRAYFRMISGVDRVIGRILQALETHGLLENTVIIYSADNGYYMGDRGFAGKWSHFEESLRVPLIVRDPRFPSPNPGTVRSEMVLNIDIPATLLDLAGIPRPEGYTGKSLFPLLRGAEVPGWREAFFAEHLMEHAGIPKWQGIRGSRYVYARYFEQEPPYEFLHDLERDPDQLLNFASDPRYSAVLQALRARTRDWQSTLEALPPPVPRGGDY